MSDELIAYRCTFCVILHRKKIFKISNYVFFRIARDPLRNGNVVNELADRMEALSDSCGAGFRSKSASEQPKSRFWP